MIDLKDCLFYLLNKGNLMNGRIKSTGFILPPALMRLSAMPTKPGMKIVLQSRKIISQILKGEDRRMLVILGPCSFHDPKAMLQIAEEIKKLPDLVRSVMYPVLRVYYDKPRTNVGWKGFAHDPEFNGNGNGDIAKGIKLTLQTMNRILDMGVPIASEIVDPLMAEYFKHLLSLAVIGARTTDCQTNRTYASGLPMPVCFKNNLNGDSPADGLMAAGAAHSILSINTWGFIRKKKTKGNQDIGIILRGTLKRPNHDSWSVKEQLLALKEKGLADRSLVIDCSHGNSGKDFQKQPGVFHDALNQRIDGNLKISGIMLEANVFKGNQSFEDFRKKPKYGVSITDSCISLAQAMEMISDGAKMLLRQYDRMGVKKAA
jgi:3-deoxy-7-phosphoheptulonate synthase